MGQIVFTRSALKALGRMPANTSRLIQNKIRQYAAEPLSLSRNVVKLQGREGYRLRVGNWRVIFDEDGTVLHILEIGPRGGVYDQETKEMNRIVTFTSPSGDEMVVVPAADYRNLIEAAEMTGDVAAFDDMKRKIASGEEEFVPMEMVDRLLDGENRVLVWREHRNLTAKELAEAAGITQAYLSQIETGKRDGTVGTMKKIAAALKVDLDDIV